MLIKQSTAVKIIPFFMVDVADHITGKTGLTTTVTISKNGAAFGAPAGAVTEIGSGWYKIAANATDSNTIGSLLVHATATGADPFDVIHEVIEATLAKGTDITGFNDISTANVQTELVSYGALKPTTAGRTLDVTTTGEAGIDLDNTVGTLAKGTDITGFTDLSAANVQTELVNYGALKPTVAARTLDVSTGGEAGIDWANVGSPTTTVALSGTTVGTTTNLTNDPPGVTTLLTRIPAALFTGITSVAQWLGMIAGKQTGNVTARTELRATGAGSGTYDETTDSQEATRDRGDAAWISAGSDPWLIALPGAYGAGTAGAIVGNNLNATVSSRATQTSVDAVAAKTNNLPPDPADASDIAASFATVNSSLTTISGYIDTEVGAIKAKTDQLTFGVNGVNCDVTLDVADLTALADAVLKRDFTAISGEAAYSLLNAARMLRSKWNTTGGILTVYKEDGSSVAWTRALSVDPTAQPIIGAT